MEKTLWTLMNEKDIDFEIVGDCILDKQDLINDSLEMTVQNMGDHYRVFEESGVYIADIVFTDDDFKDFNAEDEERTELEFRRAFNEEMRKLDEKRRSKND